MRDFCRGGPLWAGCWVDVGREKGTGRNLWFEHLGELWHWKYKFEEISHCNTGHFEVELALRDLNKNRHVDPYFRRKVWARYESVRWKAEQNTTKHTGFLDGGLS